MGARQSKRSVDITTGKEVAVEGSEVAAGAGGEGKLERIEDLDTLKPQLNGDAHQDEQISEKEKKMQEEDGQENEKDNCNEKEIILSPVTVNGGGEGEATAKDTPETNKKKPKKEKVTKKWSFRSISFSKKDKQKPPKKEETNGECDKVPEEGADAAPVGEVIVKSEVVIAEKEVPKVDDSEKTNDKEAETPVTEPLTNGSSAPETPKEEVRQNGDAASVEQQPSPAESVPEVVTKVPEEPKVEEKVEVSEPVEKLEAAKPAESVPAPDVESLPINGLKIEDSVSEEVKPPVEEAAQPEVQKVEDVITASETVAEPIEEKCAVIADAEVCVEKEKSEAVGNVEVAPPPLPSSPPPSSLTMFAESTMAPLVDTNVENLPVNVEASITSSPLAPAVDVKDDVQSTQSDSVTPLVCEINPVNNLPTALPNKEGEDSQSSLVPSLQEIAPESSDALLPNEKDSSSSDSLIEPAIVKETSSHETCENPSLVENVAVVSSNETISPNPEQIKEIPSSIDSQNDIPPALADTVDEVAVQKEDIGCNSPVDLPDPSYIKPEISSPVEPENPININSSEILETLEKANVEVATSSNEVLIASEKSLENTDGNLLKTEEVSIPSADEIVHSSSNTDSPILQRVLSDQDVSETFAEPPSDSFPPPPPPESCPESITELSASESLPPPMSEFSVPDTILNSPTSEIAELPCKDETSLKAVKVPEVEDSQETDSSAKAEVQYTDTAPELNGLPPVEAPEAISLPVLDSAEQQLEPSPIDTLQVKSVSEVVDVPSVTPEAAATESAPSGDSTAE